MNKKELKSLVDMFSIIDKKGRDEFKGVHLSSSKLGVTATVTNGNTVSSKLIIDNQMELEGNFIPLMELPRLKANTPIDQLLIDNDKFPIDSISAYLNNKLSSREHVLSISIDSVNLVNMVKAMSTPDRLHGKSFRFSFAGQGEAILIDNHDGDRGLIMPLLGGRV